MVTKWNTSVNELLEILKGSLISLIPWLEKAHVKFIAGESYDDWDNISDALYKNIVCATIFGEVKNVYPIAEYDIQYDSYVGKNFIIVESPNLTDLNLAFVSFQTIERPMDTVKVASLNDKFEVIEFINLQENLNFTFRFETKDSLEFIQNIQVQI